MHGQKRSEYKSRLLNAETASKLAVKAQHWNALSNELLTQRQRLFDRTHLRDKFCYEFHPYDANASPPSPEVLLTLTEKMLTVNPDPIYLWNIRREMLLYLIQHNSSLFHIHPELKLTSLCLQRNPKSYASWFHRKWSIAFFLNRICDEVMNDASPSKVDMEQEKEQNTTNIDVLAIIQSELDLCTQFLLLDERNFHCWNYRRFTVGVLCSSDLINMNPNENNITNEFSVDMDALNGSWPLSLYQQVGYEASLPITENTCSIGAQLSMSKMKSTCLISAVNNKETESFNKIPVSKSINFNVKLAEVITNEWDFTTSRINDNFSNGSAFHYRSLLLPLVLETCLASSSEGIENVTCTTRTSDRKKRIQILARAEWENVVLNAIFTEPDDQTPWWYHRFIVDWADPFGDSKSEAGEENHEVIADYLSLLSEMAASCRDLIQVEMESDISGSVTFGEERKGSKCKWAYLGLYLVLSSILRTQFNDLQKQHGGISHDISIGLFEEAKDCLEKLMKIDPFRKERYFKLADEISHYKALLSGNS